MKKPTLLFLMILPFLLIGCGAGGIFSQSPKKTSDVNIYFGTQGLTAEFSRTAPPPIVYQDSGKDSNFPIFLRIRNSGAYDIKEKKGIIALGVERDYVKDITVERNPRVGIIESNTLPFEVDGRSQINLKGDEIFVNFNAKAGKLDPQSETHTSTITATLCYPYQTLAGATICIDTDPAQVRPGKKVCQAKDINFGGGQGAPINLLKIESQMVPDGDKIIPQFLIYVENTGSGDVVNPEKYKGVCKKPQSSDKDIWNVAFIKVYTSKSEGESQLECTPSLKDSNFGTDELTGLLKFKDRKDFVKCEFKEGISRDYDPYTSPLKILIEYGYVQSIATNFDIKKPLKY